MSLSGQQSKELQNALIDAFLNIVSLERMLWYGLEKNLRAIVGEGSLQDMVFKLIQEADSQGWVEDLVRAARDENPGNPKLKAIAQEILNPNSGKQQQEKLDDDLSSASNVDYTQLRDFLKKGWWTEADEETVAVMLKVAGKEKEGRLDIQCIENFPDKDLRTIDQLWVEYSDGYSGFSVQKSIWQQQSVNKNYKKFFLMTSQVNTRGHFPRLVLGRIGRVKWHRVVLWCVLLFLGLVYIVLLFMSATGGQGEKLLFVFLCICSPVVLWLYSWLVSWERWLSDGRWFSRLMNNGTLRERQ